MAVVSCAQVRMCYSAHAPDNDGYPRMGNAAWVCFDCRESVRRPTHYKADVPCPKCAQICRCIGTKIPVPPKRDVPAWRELRESLDAQAIRLAESQHRRRIRQRHSVE